METVRRGEQQMILRRVSWTIAWVVPAVALIVGIALTSTGTAEIRNQYGEGPIDYDVSLLAVWPAGLVLLGVGLLGLIAAALFTAAILTKR